MPAHLPLYCTARATPFSLDQRIPSNPNMTSTTSDAGQQKLRHSFTPPASQADDVLLCGEEALSDSGESRETAILISDDTDTEDEDDGEGRNFDKSQSYTTPTAISAVDYLGEFTL
jgi:hypothetical protein